MSQPVGEEVISLLSTAYSVHHKPGNKTKTDLSPFRAVHCQSTSIKVGGAQTAVCACVCAGGGKGVVRVLAGFERPLLTL